MSHTPFPLVKVSTHLIVGTFLTCFGSSMLYGYNLGILNLPEAHVKDFLGSRYSNATVERKTALYSVATGIFLAGGAIGAFFSGFIADYFGRKQGLVYNNVLMILAALMFYIAHFSQIPEFIYLGRAISGISSGLTQTLASMYLTEIAPIRLRGFIGACHTLALSVGTALSNLLTFEEIIGSRDWWMIAAGLIGFPSIIEGIFHLLLPESPRYLLKIGKVQEALYAHNMYDPDQPEKEFLQEMVEEEKVDEEQREFRFLHIFGSAYTRPMLIACFIQVLQEFSGINVVTAYSKTMMESAGVPSNVIQYCAFGLGPLYIICGVISLPLLECVGRRPLLLWPTALLALCLVGLAISVQLQVEYKAANDFLAARSASFVSILLIYFHSAAFTVGPYNVATIIAAEIFRQGPRGAAFSVSQCVLWAGNLIVVLVYPNVEKFLNGYVFLIFLAFVVPIWIMFFFIMPETKGRTVDDVCRSMQDPIEWNPCATTEEKVTDSPNEEDTIHLKQIAYEITDN